MLISFCSRIAYSEDRARCKMRKREVIFHLRLEACAMAAGETLRYVVPPSSFDITTILGRPRRLIMF